MHCMRYQLLRQWLKNAVITLEQRYVSKVLKTVFYKGFTHPFELVYKFTNLQSFTPLLQVSTDLVHCCVVLDAPPPVDSTDGPVTFGAFDCGSAFDCGGAFDCGSAFDCGGASVCGGTDCCCVFCDG